MAREKRVPFNRKAYITQYTTILILLMALGWLLLATNVGCWFPLPWPVQVLTWIIGLVPVIPSLVLASVVFPRRDRDKDPSETTDKPEAFGADEMVIAEYMMLIMLVGVALLVGFVPLYFKPESDLRKVRGPVTAFASGRRGGFGVKIPQDGKAFTIRAQSGITDQLRLIELGDQIEAMLDGHYAMELHRNGQVLFTYDEYQQHARWCARNGSIMLALAAVGFAVWSRRHAKKKGLIPKSGDDESG